MKYIKLINGNPISYTIEEFIEEHPDVQIYTKVKGIPDRKVLERYDVYPLITTEEPKEGKPIELPPIKNYNGEWIQQWESVPFTEEEIKQQNFEFPKNNPGIFASNEQRLERMQICQGCDRYREITRQCKECGCFMVLKTQLKVSDCPLGKWGKIV